MTPEEQERIIAEAVRREVAKAPPLPADAVDLLRRIGFPTVARKREEAS